MIMKSHLHFLFLNLSTSYKTKVDMLSIHKITTFLILFFFAGHIQAQQTEEELIMISFEKFKWAVVDNKPEQAVKYIDTKSISYYSLIIDKTKNADSLALDSMNILDKLMILTMRHVMPHDDILNLDGKGLFKYAVKNGIAGKDNLQHITTGKMIINNDTAFVQAIKSGEPSNHYLNFHKEEGVWKFDITSLFKISETSFKKVQIKSGKSENEFLFAIIKLLTGYSPGNEVWLKVDK